MMVEKRNQPVVMLIVGDRTSGWRAVIKPPTSFLLAIRGPEVVCFSRKFPPFSLKKENELCEDSGYPNSEREKDRRYGI